MGNGRLQLASAHRHRAKIGSLPSADEGYDLLRSFFESCWHVKDHALSDLPQPQHKPFEEAVEREFSLNVVADVANRSKHVKLTRRDRIGAAVTFKAIQAFDGGGALTPSTAEYSISLKDGTIRSAIAIADAALLAWDSVLKSFKL